MDFSEYKAIIDKTYPYAMSVSLFLYGEPLLNKDIVKMIAYSTSKGIISNLHTNMSIMDNTLAESLIESGLSKLYFSVDGYTQSVYSKYRVGGNIEEVFRNIEIFIAARERLKKKNPIMILRYLINRYNEHEIEIACSYAKKLKIDIFSKEYFQIPDAKEERIRWATSIEKYSLYNKNTLNEKYRFKRFCDQLWKTLVIDCEGDLYFCCFAARKKENSYGNLFNNSLKGLWNSRQMFLARELVKSEDKDIKEDNLCCFTCGFLPKNFEKIAHKRR